MFETLGTFLNMAWIKICFAFHVIYKYAVAFFQLRISIRLISMTIVVMIIPLVIVKGFFSYQKKRRAMRDVRKGH